MLTRAIDPHSNPTQEWDLYTADDHEAWSRLFRRRIDHLVDCGSRVFLDGAEIIGLNARRVPDLRDVNRVLIERTGWSAVPVAGFIPADRFFASIAERRFPTTITVRPLNSLDYVSAPDIFHDVFGHVPLHAHPVFANFLQRFGAVAALAKTDADVERMARLFWFTVEFGLVKEDGQTKVYGSGLISSQGDCENALGPNCERRPFDLDDVFAQPFEIDRLQDVLFVVEDFDQLFRAVEEAERRLA